MDRKITPPPTPEESGKIFTAGTLAIFAASLVFSLIFANAEKTFAYYLLSFLLTSLCLIAVMAVWSAVKKRPFLGGIGLKKAKPRYYVMAAFALFGVVFGLSGINDLFVSLLEKIGYAKEPMYIPNDEAWQYAVWVFVVAIIPAIAEECFFRGYVLSGIKGLGGAFAVVVGGTLFCIFHQNPQQTPYQLICGMLFCLIAVKSASILPGLFMHLANNLYIITADFFKMQISDGAAAALIGLGLVSLAASVACLLVDKGENRAVNNAVKAADSNADDGAEHGAERDAAMDKSGLKREKTRFFITAALGVGICAALWIADLLAYIKW